MCDKGFIKAKSDNIPDVDIFITIFLKNDVRFNSAEVRGAKSSSGTKAAAKPTAHSP
ncbi:hypothetical protein K1T71_004837 [Dendrolimus kikuchii]|uniref:Uncharacterized protein n=1 Tax=Dendrolimus kikuchii TaxID=765133 RepID=A0ACC1D5P0_9NEOP|nr:hypothetical protein K1T71_004837 [Dendrolimus kikuchii]